MGVFEYFNSLSDGDILTIMKQIYYGHLDDDAVGYNDQSVYLTKTARYYLISDFKTSISLLYIKEFGSVEAQDRFRKKRSVPENIIKAAIRSHKIRKITK
jgi:hypothetical protein